MLWSFSWSMSFILWLSFPSLSFCRGRVIHNDYIAHLPQESMTLTTSHPELCILGVPSPAQPHQQQHPHLVRSPTTRFESKFSEPLPKTFPCCAKHLKQLQHLRKLCGSSFQKLVEPKHSPVITCEARNSHVSDLL